MNEILNNLQENQLALVIVSLFAYIVVFNSRNSYVLSVGLYIALCLIHQSYDSYIMSLEGVERITAAQMWYFGFAVTDFLYVLLVYKLHDKLKLQANKVSRFMLTGFIVLGFMQIARYIDRIVIDTNHLAELYQISIPAINISVTLLIVYSSVASIAIHYYHKFKTGNV